MMDGRKKVKLTIEITPRDILSLEDLYSSIPVCSKHMGFSKKSKVIPERELMTMYYECSECAKVYDSLRYALMRVEGNLVKEHLKLLKKSRRRDAV